MQIPTARGYVTDVPYVWSFIRQTAPAWLDHVALVAGVAPPEREGRFTWCDLGCGHGLTAAILAATHPEGSFHGIDGMPAHIDSACRFASEAGIPNINFHAADFDDAADLDFPSFDYIVSQGVYTWVGERARLSWRRFIDRYLKPGGLLYVSYNAMPGRAADLPLQRLVWAVGRSKPGNSREQLTTALGVVRSMVGLKVPALVSSPMANEVTERGERFDPGYLMHEFMVPEWDPACVTEVRAFLADIGLKPAGSATLVENYDSFVLGRAAREALAAIGDADAREMARDYFIDQFFRRDVFIRDGLRLDENERRRRLLQSTFFLAKPVAGIEYGMSTAAGHLRFDNAVARHIVNALAAGPRRLADIAEPSTTEPSIPNQDLLANTLTLGASLAVWPVEGSRASVERLNAAICKRLGGAEEIRFLALPCGTALPAGRDLLTRLRDGNCAGDEYSSWVQFQLNRS